MPGRIENRLHELGLVLPEPLPPLGAYVPVVVAKGIAYMAGHGPIRAGSSAPAVTGRVPSQCTIEEGYEAARLSALSVLASFRAALGDLDRIARIIKLFGMVQSDPGFDRQPEIINGASDLLLEIFGEENGRHARSAVGMAALPRNISVEIELTFELVG
ncbi:MAG: RidA family protein [Alphaproteobacteria bacterium]